MKEGYRNLIAIRDVVNRNILNESQFTSLPFSFILFISNSSIFVQVLVCRPRLLAARSL